MIHLLLLSPLVDFDDRFDTEELLNGGIVLFALLLLALSLSAYRKTHLRSLLLVSAAFGLFAVEVAIRQIDDFVLAVGFQTEEIIIILMEFMILLLFFLAIVVRR